jgi:hypothetical protein
MSIPNRQIGSSQESNLLWQIAKQLEKLIKVLANSPLEYLISLKEDLSNKSTNTSLGTSDTLYPTQNAVKVYADTKNEVFEFANLAAFPVTGETGKIYLAIDTNKTYRWSGSAYVQIGGGGSVFYSFEMATPALPTTTNWQVSNYNSSKSDDIFRNNTATTYPTLNSDVGARLVLKTGKVKRIVFKMLRRNPGIAVDFDIYVAKFQKANGVFSFGTETIIATQNISSAVLNTAESFIREFTLTSDDVTTGEWIYVSYRNNTGITVTLFNPEVTIEVE